jgi:hypothetical protein
MNIEKAKDDLKKLYGHPPYNTWTNICYGDAYFARAIEKEHGKSCEELQKITGINGYHEEGLSR